MKIFYPTGMMIMILVVDSIVITFNIIYLYTLGIRPIICYLLSYLGQLNFEFCMLLTQHYENVSHISPQKSFKYFIIH